MNSEYKTTGWLNNGVTGNLLPMRYAISVEYQPQTNGRYQIIRARLAFEIFPGRYVGCYVHASLRVLDESRSIVFNRDLDLDYSTTNIDEESIDATPNVVVGENSTIVAVIQPHCSATSNSVIEGVLSGLEGEILRGDPVGEIELDHLTIP